jgi:hypothetical protein
MVTDCSRPRQHRRRAAPSPSTAPTPARSFTSRDLVCVCPGRPLPPLPASIPAGMRPVAVNFSRPRADLYPIVFIPAGMRPLSARTSVIWRTRSSSDHAWLHVNPGSRLPGYLPVESSDSRQDHRSSVFGTRDQR